MRNELLAPTKTTTRDVLLVDLLLAIVRHEFPPEIMSLEEWEVSCLRICLVAIIVTLRNEGVVDQQKERKDSKTACQEGGVDFDRKLFYIAWETVEHILYAK